MSKKVVMMATCLVVIVCISCMCLTGCSAKVKGIWKDVDISNADAVIEKVNNIILTESYSYEIEYSSVSEIAEVNGNSCHYLMTGDGMYHEYLYLGDEENPVVKRRFSKDEPYVDDPSTKIFIRSSNMTAVLGMINKEMKYNKKENTYTVIVDDPRMNRKEGTLSFTEDGFEVSLEDYKCVFSKVGSTEVTE